MTFQPTSFPRPAVKSTSFAFWIFVALSGEYGWYLKLPQLLIWSLAGGAFAFALLFGKALLTWPDKFQDHLEDIRTTVKGVQ
jgi:hypothetical protein